MNRIPFNPPHEEPAGTQPVSELQVHANGVCSQQKTIFDETPVKRRGLRLWMRSSRQVRNVNL